MPGPGSSASGQHCFVCGEENDHGLRLAFRSEDNRIRATFVPGARSQGYDGLTHGGVLTAVLDDAMVYCLYQCGINAFTARISVRFRQPVAIGARLEIYGELVSERARFAKARAWATAPDGSLVAEAESTIIRPPAP